MKSFVTACLLICMYCCTLLAQGEQNLNLYQAPPSPEVAALGKFTQVPVSLFTGIPQINYPLYTINQKRFTVPVDLSYHAGGVKVEEIASRVGLGWSLNAGGMITRQMRTLPDDITGGYLRTEHTLQKFDEAQPMHGDVLEDELRYHSLNIMDYEPDLFFFNFSGYSGSFYFDQNTHLPVLQDYAPIKIEPTFGRHPDIEDQTQNVITSFIITVENGVQYYFGRGREGAEYTIQLSGGSKYNTVTSRGTGANSNDDQKDKTHIATWYLKEIHDPVTNQSVYFNYQGRSSFVFRRTSENKTIPNPTWAKLNAPVPMSICHGIALDPTSTVYFSGNTAVEYDLQEIVFDQGKVIFIQDNQERQDIAFGKALKQVTVLDIHNKKINAWGLNHFYTTSDALGGYEFQDHIPDNQKEKGSKRLFLESIDAYEISSSNTINTNNYQRTSFEYIEPDKLPNRFSVSQDYWGFYNGANNENLMDYGVHALNNGNSNTPQFAVVGYADRAVSPEEAQYGTLNKITYPTGGTKTFVYESNGEEETEEVENDDVIIDPSYSQLVLRPVWYSFSNHDVSAQVFDTSPEYIKFEWFFELESAQAVTFNIDVPCDSAEDDTDTCPWILHLEGVSENITNIHRYFTHEKQEAVHLQKGTYRVRAEFGEYYNWSTYYEEGLDYFELGFYVYQWVEEDHPVNGGSGPRRNGYLGGLHIKEIITTENDDHDSNTPAVRRFEYTNEDGSYSGESVGGHPYSRSQTALKWCHEFPKIYSVLYTTYSSTSQVSMSQTAGKPVGHRRVVEYYGDKEMGKTVHEFSLFADTFTAYPLAILNNMAYARGKPLSKTIYRNVNGTFKPEKKIEYQYTSIERDRTVAYKVGAYYAKLMGAGDPKPLYNGEIENYYLHSRWYRLDQTLTTTYDLENNQDIFDKVEYIYNPETLNVIKETRFSDTFISTIPHSIKTRYYPDDIAVLDVSGYLNIQKTVAQTLNKNNTHRINELMYSSIQGEGQLKSRTALYYQEWGANSMLLPEYTMTEKEGFENHPIVSGKIIAYDKWGNQAEIKSQEYGISTSYIWGYNGNYPIVKLEGVSYSQIPEATITHLQDLSDQDTDSCAFSHCKEQALRDVLQQIRLDFPLAMITTYTYDPLIGMTSVTDPKGNTSYYVYDGYNRLQLIKDKNENIITSYDYNYKN